VNKLGDVKEVYVVGDFARGRDSRVIDLIFVGLGIDKEYLVKLTVGGINNVRFTSNHLEGRA